MKLNVLIGLQIAFAVMAIFFLLTSGWFAYTTGKPLSAAPVTSSIIMFLIYSGSLLLPKFKRIGWYRIAMGIAIIPFGIGGVVMNIVNYLQNGLRDYSSFEIFLIAVGINTFGTVWNIMASLGLFTVAHHDNK